MKRDNVQEARKKDRSNNRIKLFFEDHEHLEQINLVKKIRKRQYKGESTYETNTPLSKMLNLVNRTRESKVRRNLRSTTTENAKQKHQTKSVLRNSRSRHHLSPNAKPRLSTAKQARDKILPNQNVTLSNFQNNLPKLPKVVHPKLKKRSITKALTRQNILLSNSTSNEVYLPKHEMRIGNMKKNRFCLKKQAQRYHFLAEGPMTMDKFGINFNKPRAGT